MGITLGFIGGCCLVLFGVMAFSAWSPTATESTSLIGMPTSLRNPMLPKVCLAMKSCAMSSGKTINMHDLPGPSPWKELAITAIEMTNHDRDVSMSAVNRMKSQIEGLSSADKAVVAKASSATTGKMKDLMKAGQGAPFGFWDPWGLSTDIPYGKMVFYRDAELKHGRVAMLATLGIFSSEKAGGSWFGGSAGSAIDLLPAASYPVAELSDLQETSLQAFYGACIILLGLPELTSLLAPFPLGVGSYPDSDARLPGEYNGFDPLYIRPPLGSDELLEIQNKELNNGRLAMIAAAGIIAQEMVTGKGVFSP